MLAELSEAWRGSSITIQHTTQHTQGNKENNCTKLGEYIYKAFMKWKIYFHLSPCDCYAASCDLVFLSLIVYSDISQQQVRQKEWREDGALFTVLTV